MSVSILEPLLNLLDDVSRRRRVLDDEALDLVVDQVARPDDRKVTPWLAGLAMLFVLCAPCPTPVQTVVTDDEIRLGVDVDSSDVILVADGAPSQRTRLASSRCRRAPSARVYWSDQSIMASGPGFAM